MRGLVGMTVFSITHPRGLAMSGVTKGVSFTLPRHNGVTEKINVINGCHMSGKTALYQQGRPVRSFHRKPFKFFAAWTTSSVQELKPTAVDFLAGHKRDKERSPRSPDRQVAPV